MKRPKCAPNVLKAPAQKSPRTTKSSAITLPKMFATTSGFTAGVVGAAETEETLSGEQVFAEGAAGVVGVAEAARASLTICICSRSAAAMARMPLSSAAHWRALRSRTRSYWRFNMRAPAAAAARLSSCQSSKHLKYASASVMSAA